MTTDTQRAEALLRRIRVASLVMGSLPEDPGYNGSRLILDDTEAAEIVATLDAAHDALASPAIAPAQCEWTNCPRRVGDVCCMVNSPAWRANKAAKRDIARAFPVAPPAAQDSRNITVHSDPEPVIRFATSAPSEPSLHARVMGLHSPGTSITYHLGFYFGRNMAADIAAEGDATIAAQADLLARQKASYEREREIDEETIAALRAEVARLSALNSALTDKSNVYLVENARLAESVTQLQARLDAAQADAERYRWLRATTNWATSKGERVDVRDKPELCDSAIDAARASAKEQP